MPYKIKKSDGKHCVVKTDGKQIACHDTRAKALKQVAALYANEKAEQASILTYASCVDEACDRAFLNLEAMLDHAQSVHGEDVEEAREVKAPERKKLAKQGKALPGGGFPINSVQDLKNAIQAFGRAKDKAQAKAHIIRAAKRLKATNLLPDGWIKKPKSDSAQADILVDCPDCARAFIDESTFIEHAEATHTFDDTRRIVHEYIREKFGRVGDYKANPVVPGIWTWIEDLASDWVVYTVESGNDTTLYKASYSIVDDVVTLGEPTEVRRRTVYEPIKKEGS